MAVRLESTRSPVDSKGDTLGPEGKQNTLFSPDQGILWLNPAEVVHQLRLKFSRLVEGLKLAVRAPNI